ncbi:hypothetical protein [Allokutzneria oryzae]|uniref:DUF3806 domain-containing protein n=1 Tax=Allokutzneria oryzae TaxID=1378989 RepID=A0ABV6A762_9PSEU
MPEPIPARDVPVPSDALALSTLARIDYANAVLVEIAPAWDQSAEHWARAVLEGAPADMRHALTSGWSALGLQLGSTESDRFVLGWTVRHATADHILLGADSPIGLRGELLFQRRPHALVFASFIQHDTDDARAMWDGVKEIHPQVMRQLVDAAVSRALTS